MDKSSDGPGAGQLLASVVISTYNRRDALLQTLAALGNQSVPADRYEVVVVDDGSSDGTSEAACAVSLPCRLTVLRHNVNRGVSAGRNLAARHATGRYLVLLSDDLIVPGDFLQTHLDTQDRFPGWWVVGGFAQLPSMTDTPFGRFLDRLEKQFDEARKTGSPPLTANMWEMSWPTARNLSLSREHFETLGGFDEQFRTTCEDQDLAERARRLGVRYVYNASITCLHNDQAGDLQRYCNFQRRGMLDTVRFCAKYPESHGRAPVARLNGPIARGDGLAVAAKKLAKTVLGLPPCHAALWLLVRAAERARLPDPALARLYRMLIGLAMFKGYREGLRRLPGREGGGRPGLPTPATRPSSPAGVSSL